MMVFKNVLFSFVFLFSLFFTADISCINEKIIETVDLIEKASSITLLVGTPDGDAVSAAVALSEGLIGLGKNVETIYNGQLAFNFSRQPKKVLIKKHRQTPDLLISLDEANKKNLYWCEDFNSVSLVNIDHHGSNNNYGNVNLIDTNTAACCEVLINIFLESSLIGVNLNIAQALVFGILCDTQGLQERLLKKNTMPLILRLIDLDLLSVDHLPTLKEEYKKVMDELTEGEANLWSDLKETIKIDDDLIPVSMTSFFDIPSDGSKLSTWIKLQRKFFNLEDVKKSKLQAFIYVISEGLIRDNKKSGYNISLRSKNGEALKVAKSFNGGGHENAASFFVALDGNKASREEIISDMRRALGEID